MKLVYPQVITGADFLNGIIKLDELAPLLKRRGAVSAAIVNSSLSGVRSFWKVMSQNNIHPVIGLSLHIEMESGETPLCYVYAKNEIGFQQLLKASSAAATRDSGTLPEKWLKPYSENCAVVLPLTSPTWDTLRYTEYVQQFTDLCTVSDLYVGIERQNGRQHDEEAIVVKIAESLGLPIIACNEARFLHREESFAFETAQAIRGGFKLSDPDRPSNLYEHAYLPEQDELNNWFQGQEHWLKQTEDLMLSCQVMLPEKKILMPSYPLNDNESSPTVLERNCRAGLQKQYANLPEQYENRLRKELDVITKMGYADYFLIVQDFINYAKQNGIEVGPGRGSSAGSLVAFSLGITAVDPIVHGLIFERFLNESRITMPDIDVDFADSRRLEVVEYVAEKYGKAKVAQIITFGTLSAKSVARNTARVFNFSNDELSFISKSLTASQGSSLRDKIANSPNLQQWIAQDDIRKKWLDVSSALEGLPRNASTHAAGVILSPIPLVETIPLQAGGESTYLTQWEMKDAEEAGLLKMDFLGLRNLTLLDRIRKLIKYDTGETINIETIPFTDSNTFELFKKGEMLGIFQFESPGMRKALRDIEPDRFEDIYAITALYRPGPMENIPLYSRRKKGLEAVHYSHPVLEPILKETYGIIVYQEQIMQIAVQVAGFSMGEADLLRRAISKKNRSILEKERKHFTESAMKNGFPERIAADIYDLIVKFADYGFPKSHAVAYSIISYQLAYVKANFPVQFYSACLSILAGSPEKTMEYLREIQSKQIAVLGPSIRTSLWSATTEQGAIRLGMNSVKGIPFSFYTALKEARDQKSRIHSLFDLAVAVGADQFTDKIILPLIKSGALDELGERREVLFASIEAARKHALFVRPSNQADLFSNMLNGMASPKYSPAGEMPIMQRLEYEKEVLGFYLSEHPAEAFKKTLENPVVSINSVSSHKLGTVVTIAGLLINCKRIRTKKGEAMAFLEIQDESGDISCTVFPKVYEVSSHLLNEYSLVFCKGKIEKRNGNLQIIVQEIISRS